MSTLIVWLAVGALVAYVLWPRKRYFPGPPLIGVFGTLFSTLRHLKRRHRHHLELVRDFGTVIQINRSPQPLILVCAPTEVKYLIEHRDLFPDRPALTGFQKVTPLGLLGLEVQDPLGRWATHRRLLSPLFAEKLMRVYAGLLSTQTDKLVSVLRASNGAPVDMVATMCAMALDAIGLCAFATDFGALDGLDDPRHFSRKFSTAATDALNAVVRLTLVPWFLRVFDFGSHGVNERTREPFQNVITKLRAEFFETETAPGSAGAESKTMLSELLHSEARGDLSSAEVDDEMRTFLLAGFDTTAHTMAWTFYLLARNPDVQERLRALPTEAERIQYAKLCALETLRHRPTVVATPRLSSAPFTLRGVELPADTLVVVSFAALNFGEHWGPDVLEYKPERHQVERPSHEFMPFGFGTRICIGKRFALLEAETVIAKVVSQFRFKLAPDGEPTEALTLTLSPAGLKLIFEPISK
jgi:cytochrome P450